MSEEVEEYPDEFDEEEQSGSKDEFEASGPSPTAPVGESYESGTFEAEDSGEKSDSYEKDGFEAEDVKEASDEKSGSYEKDGFEAEDGKEAADEPEESYGKDSFEPAADKEGSYESDTFEAEAEATKESDEAVSAEAPPAEGTAPAAERGQAEGTRPKVQFIEVPASPPGGAADAGGRSALLHRTPSASAGGPEAPPVVVKVIGAAGLRDSDDAPGQGGSDPYCVISVEGKAGTEVRTGTVKNTEDLCWNFAAEMPCFDRGDNLVFTVFDKDEGDPDDFLGRALLVSKRLEAVAPGDTLEAELHLETRKGAALGAVLGVAVEVPVGGLRTPARHAPRFQDDEDEVAHEGGRRPSAESTPSSRKRGTGLPTAQMLQALTDEDDEEEEEEAAVHFAEPVQEEEEAKPKLRKRPTAMPSKAMLQQAAEEDEDEERMVVVEDELDAPVRPHCNGEDAFAAEEVVLGTGSPEGCQVMQGSAGVALRGARSPQVRTSASTPELTLSPKRRRRQRGVPKTPSSSFDPKAQRWDERWHLVDQTNDLKPQQLRTYFSKPKSVPELRAHLEKRGDKEALTSLHNLNLPEEEAPKPMYPITADTGPEVIPSRYKIGGSMPDPDGAGTVPWNDRWQAGMCLFGEALHPLHRSTFSKPSLFEDARSQLWRRHVHLQVASGVWRPGPKQHRRFPPIGV